MFLKQEDLNITGKKTVKIRHTLDNQATKLLCQTGFIHEGYRASLRHCVTTEIF